MRNFFKIRQIWRPSIVIYSGFLLISVTSWAEEVTTSDVSPFEVSAAADVSDPTADVLQELVTLLNQESELATKSKMNIDFVPGIMSVMHGKDLIARGVQNVYEAIGLIPGVELSRTNDGQPQVLVRGIGKTFFSSKIKFLLNNAPFNATLGAATPILILPIEQVERIEVIRGPGSAVYGEYASVGVVNVITRTDQIGIFTRVSDIGKKSIGGMYSYTIPEREFSISLSASKIKADGGDVEAGPDFLSQFPPPNNGVSNAPGKINNAESHGSIILDIYYGDYSVSLQHVQQGLGDYFGLNNALPEDEQKVKRYITMQNLEVSRDWKLNDDWESKGTVGFSQFEVDSGVFQLFPDGFVAPPPASTPFAEGVLGSPHYHDKTYYLGAEFIYTGLENHELLMGGEISKVKPDDIYVRRNYNPVGLQPLASGELTRFEGADNWLEEGHDRRVISIYVQDQLLLSEKLKLTAGLRFDHYDDIEGDIMPRLAAVYHLADKQTLKFQYARSFRPPTFLELYTQNNLIVSGNKDLDSERLDTIEAGYVFNNGSLIFRSTFFYFVAHDLIVINTESPRQYENAGEITSTGFELELQHQLSRSVKIDATVTKLYTENDQANDDVAGVADLVSNFAFILQPWPDYAFGVQFKAVADRPREPGDPRQDLDGYTVIDVTANFFNLGFRNLNLRTGIKNIFDNDIVYPAPMASLPNGSPVPAYLNDYPQTGREIFLQLDYQFD